MGKTTARPLGITPALALGIALVAPSASAQQITTDDLRTIENQLAATDVALKTLRSDYDRAARNPSTRSFSSRLRSAQNLVGLKEFEQAALILVTLVPNPEAPTAGGDPTHSAAVKALAESLYQIGNDLGARRRYQQLAHDDAQQLENAVRHLMVLSERLQDNEGLDTPLQRLRARGPLPPDILYLQARAKLSEGQPKQALDIAKGVPADHPSYAKALYVIGVAYVRLGDIERALRHFAILRQLDNPFRFESGPEIRSLATMNVGRLRLEQRGFDASVAAYDTVDQEGDHFTEALYEKAWAHVQASASASDEDRKKQELRRAMQTLEIYLLANPHTTTAAEAKLLFGNIQLRSGQLDAAMASFNGVLEIYRPAAKNIAELAQRLDKPQAFLDELVNPSSKNAGMLSPAATAWAMERKEIVDAMSVTVDLNQAELWLLEASKLLVQLQKALEQGSQFTPALETSYARLLELESQLDTARETLLRAELNVLLPHATAEQRAQLEAIEAQRQDVEKRYAVLPKSKSDYEKMLSTIHQKLKDLGREAFALRLPLVAQKRKIDGLKTWLSEHVQEMSPADLETLRTRVGRMEEAYHQHDLQLSAVEDDIKQEQRTISIVDLSSGSAAAVRQNRQALLAQEVALLAAIDAQNLSADAQRRLSDTRRLRLDVATHDDGITRLKDLYTGLGENTKAEAKRTLADLQRVLDAQKNDILSLRSAAEPTLADATRASLGQLEQVFDEIVLRADVGIVDVAWALKEQRTNEINQQVEEQRDQLQILDADFAEVLGE